MKTLRSVNEIVNNINVVLRIDSDLPISEGVILDNSRLIKSLDTIKLLLERDCKIIILGHRGRPKTRGEEYSLKPIYLELMSLLESEDQNIVESVFLEEIDKNRLRESLAKNQIIFLENVRFWDGEEECNFDFLEPIINLAEAFVNDAFAVAHRENASTMLHKKLSGYYGISFVSETEKILRVLENPSRPLTVVLGGAKKDKLEYLPRLMKIVDYVLIGGKLPKMMNGLVGDIDKEKVMVAGLKEDGLDLSENDIKKFREKINESKTIIWAGAMGFYELRENRKGTEEVARSIAESKAYKIIAGGDTGASISHLELEDKIDLVASGGGVMLELLTTGRLPTFE